MSEDKEPTPAAPAKNGASPQEVALELMRFIAQTTGFGKTSGGAGFGGKPLKTPEEQAEALLQLYGRCLGAVDKK